MENDSQPTTPDPQTPVIPEQSVPPPKKSLFSNKPFLILLIILIFIVASFVSLMVYTSRNIVTDNFNIIPTISPSPTPTPDPTASWKTYSNTKNGYSFKYPPNLIVKNGVGLGEPEKLNITDSILVGEDSLNSKLGFTLTTLPEEKTIEEIKTNLEKNPNASAIIDYQIANSSGLKYSLSGITYIDILKNGILYEFSISKGNVDQILSTFKFTDSGLSPTPTCRPRPACLDATPRCLIPETSDTCPPTVILQIKAGKS